MTKTSKATAKIRVDEVTTGMTIKGNLIGGFHTVAAIKHGVSELRNTATLYTFVDADGVEFFVGRAAAKATPAA